MEPRRARPGRGLRAAACTALALATLGAGLARADADADPDAAAEAGGGEAACVERAVDAIQRRYEGVRDVSARFVQTTRPATLGPGSREPETSRGHLVLAKPGKMRWSYREPRESLVVSDGETLWLYDPEFGEVQKLPMAQGFLSGAAAQFLLGGGDLRRDFTISALACGPEQARLSLVPREPATYERIVLEADPRTGDVRRSRVVDLVGNVSTVEFHDMERNRDPDPETFRFDPPEGVKVIEIER